MKEPKDCQTLSDVRSEIDRLDQLLINTIGRRQEYVHEAARFKRSDNEVHAHERQRQMIAARRLWAENKGVAPDLVESLFRTMVDHFVAAELKIVSERVDQGTGRQPSSNKA